MDNDDAGSAIVEFLLLSLLLLIPVVYLVLAVAQVQAASFAAEAVARDVSRAMVAGGVNALAEGASPERAEAAAYERADKVLAVTLADFGVRAAGAEVEIDCSSDPCLAPGSEVWVSVTIAVRLPAIASLLPPDAVTVTTEGASPVDGLLP